MTIATTSPPDRCGWTVNEWKALTALGATTVNELIRTRQIQSAKIGGRRIILTHPREFLESRAGG